VTELAARGFDPSVGGVDRSIAAVADRQSEIVTRDQLLVLGLSRDAIRWRVKRGLLYPLHRGVYIWGHPSPTRAGRARAAVFACGDGAVLSHHLAAELWGIGPATDEPIDVTIIRRRVRHEAIRIHETGSLDPEDIRSLHGIPLTSPARTLLDSASQLPTRELAAAVEQAQVKRLVTKHDLRATLDRAPSRAGAPALRALVDEPAFTRSEAERRLVALLRAAKLPPPAFNHVIEGLEVDAVWRVERVVLEFDSYEFHASRSAFERDRRRDSVLTRAGYLVLRTTWHELSAQPYALVARIAEGSCATTAYHQRAVSERTIDVLLIGGGIASASAAAELRERGFEGSIVLATRELDAPYHRPPITKGYLQGSEDRDSTLIHPEDWYAEHDVQLLTRTSVMNVDLDARTAKLGKEEVRFEQALVATGAMVRRLQVDGAQRDGIHYLRTLGNADALRKDVDDAERIVIIGGSYIATEVAASLTLLGQRCTLVMQEQLPTERSFGPVAGQFVADLLTAHGIEIVAGAEVVEFAGEGEDDAPITAVVCEDGRRIDADLVVIGVGALPDVMLARKIGLELGDSGGVACDRRLQTSVEGIFAAGDMCEYDSVLHGRSVRIEHEELAAAQGRAAARAMLGSDEPFADVPYFWSDLADWATLEYVGAAPSWDEEIVHGDPAAGEFSVWYVVADRLVGALTVGRSSDLDLARELIVSGGSVDRLRAADSAADSAP